MKTISNLVKSNKESSKILGIKNTVNYLSVDELKKYAEITKAFTMDETKEIIDWLIVNNKTYISDLSTDNEENAIIGFYNAGFPKDKSLQELWQKIKAIVSNHRTKEIPTLLTKNEFNDVINLKTALDSIVYDFDSEKGKTIIINKYQPLVHKICRQWVGKINQTYEDLISIANESLLNAMMSYGKKSKKSQADDSNVVKYTFGQWAAYCIRNGILEIGVSNSHVVKIPKSIQRKEKSETGKNRKNISISGDKKISSDDSNSKSVFDFMGSANDASRGLDKEDIERLWSKIYKKLEENFDKKTIDIWYSFNGLNGHEKMKNKEIATKYGVVVSNITYYCYKINNFITKNKEIMNMLKEVYELMKECLNDQDNEDDITNNVVQNVSEEKETYDE